MKAQKGVTIASLAIYITLIFIVLAILATVTANMQSGIKNSGKEGIEIAEINKFNMYFLQEVKRKGNEIITQETNNSQITFSNGKTFSYDNNKKTIKLVEGENKTIDIAKNIDNCRFTYQTIESKTIILVEITPKNLNKRDIEYVMNTDQNNYEDEESYIYVTD